MTSGHPAKKRLDLLLVERGLAETRQRAQALILAGKVFVNGQRESKAGERFPDTSQIELKGEPQQYVSRGGLKLEGALNDFHLNPAGVICMDVGASTGGFTDCLLQRGASRVYAVDVNVSQLAWKLQNDARVVRVEANARALPPDTVPEAVSFATVDVSFISVGKVLPAVARAAAAGCEFLILVKPQFELDRKDIGKGGIVRDTKLHERAVLKVRAAAEACGLTVLGVKPCRLPGAEGNQEFFLHARKVGSRDFD